MSGIERPGAGQWPSPTLPNSSTASRATRRSLRRAPATRPTPTPAPREPLGRAEQRPRAQRRILRGHPGTAHGQERPGRQETAQPRHGRAAQEPAATDLLPSQAPRGKLRNAPAASRARRDHPGTAGVPPTWGKSSKARRRTRGSLPTPRANSARWRPVFEARPDPARAAAELEESPPVPLPSTTPEPWAGCSRRRTSGSTKPRSNATRPPSERTWACATAARNRPATGGS